MRRPEDAATWPHGAGEMAARMRVFDWASTRLGPASTWPQSLRHAAETVLSAPFASVLLWGPDHTVAAYNTGYRDILNTKPDALGRPVLDVWAEEHDLLAPQLQRVLDGETLTFRELPMTLRRGEDSDDCWFDYGYGPVRDETGQVAGVVVTINEVTHLTARASQARESDERQAFLLKFSDALRPLSDPGAIQYEACRLLADRLGVDRAYYVEVDEAAGSAHVARDFTRDGVPSLAGAHRLADYGWAIAILRRGETYAIRDTQASDLVPEAERPAAAAARLIANVGVPLVKDGRLVGALCLSDERPRDWSRAEINLAGEVCERIWGAVERSRAEAALREREAIEWARAQSALHDSEERWRQFSDATPDVIWIRNARTLRMDYANPGFEGVYGVPRDAASSGDTIRWWAGLILPEDRAGAFDAIRRVRAGEQVTHEFRIRRPSDGAVRWVRNTDFPLADADGRSERIGGIGQDITTIKMAERALRRNEGSLRLSEASLRASEASLRESEAEQSFLLKLSDALRPISDPVEVQTIAIVLLGEHLGLDRCGYGEIDPSGEFVEFIRDYRAPGIEPLQGPIRLDDFGHRFADSLRTGATLIVDDVGSDDRLGEGGTEPFAAVKIMALASVPLMKSGRFTATLFAHQARPRVWTGSEIALIEEVAERTWAALERARAELALGESEERFRSFAEASSDVLWIGTADGSCLTYVSPAFETCFGLPREAVLKDARVWRDLVHPDDREAASKAMPSLKSGEAKTISYRIVRPIDGAVRHIHDAGFPIRDERGRVVRVAGIAQDVTIHAQHDAALAAVHSRQALLLGLGDAISGLDDPAEIQTEAMRVLGQHLGVARAQFFEVGEDPNLMVSSGGYSEGQPLVLEPVRLSDFGARVETAHRGGRTLVSDDIAADPRRSQAERDAYLALGYRAFIGAPVIKGGKLVAAIGLNKVEPHAWTEDEIAATEEIAERTWAAMARARAEARLRDSEERWRQFAEASPDVLWIRDAETLRMDYASPAFEALYGISAGAASRGETVRGWADLILPEDRAGALEALRRVRAGERVTHEFRIRRPPDGAVRWVRNTGYPLSDGDGRATRIGGIDQDVTELKRAEAAILGSEGRLRSLTEGIPQLVWRAADAGLWTWASPQWTAFTGQSSEDSEGWGWLDPIHPDDRDAAREAWECAARSGAFEAEYRIRRKADGRFRWFSTRASPVRDARGDIVEWLGTSTDIEELRRLQEHQRLLLGELQHRVRNSLAVIRAIARKTAEASETVEDFGAHLDGRLSAFARSQAAVTRDPSGGIDLRTLVVDELAAVTAREGDGLRIEGPDLRLTPKAGETLGLAIHELATNAVKHGALAGAGGRLTVSWRIGRDDPPSLVLAWEERLHGRTLVPPSREGFGTELLQRTLEYELEADVDLEFKPQGLHCVIVLPLRDVESSGERRLPDGSPVEPASAI